MNISLGKIEDGDEYLNRAISKGKKRVIDVKKKIRSKDSFERLLKIERERLFAIRDQIDNDMSKIVEAFPSLNNLSEFYKELIRVTLDLDRLRKELSSVSWVKSKSADLVREYSQKYKSSSNAENLFKAKRSFFGRLSSIFKRVDFEYLDRARKVFRTYPSIKSGLFTVAIAGFPNVGKSTLLSKITPSRPEINSYAFTTKGLNTGYWVYKYNKIQFIDTPGTLARPGKMNKVEEQAYLAMKYAANMIIFVYDLTEQSYPLDLQDRLFNLISDLGKPVVVFLSKRDLLSDGAVGAFLDSVGSERAFLKNVRIVSSGSVDELRKVIGALFKSEFL